MLDIEVKSPIRAILAEELAAKLRLSAFYITKLARQGKLPAEKIGRRWFFNEEESIKAFKEM